MKRILFTLLIFIRKIFSHTGVGKIPGLVRLYNKFFLTLKPAGEILTRVQNFDVFINADDVGMSQQLLERGTYEEYETEIINNVLKPGMNVVNVGANFGYYALLAASRIGSTGKVHAFEPEPYNFNLLTKNIKQNKIENIVANNFALGATKGKLSLFTDSKNVGNPSLSKLNVPNLKDEIIVAVTTLDDYFITNLKDASIGVIHMDVQGSEGLVLEGAKNILKNPNLIIFMEFWPFGLSNMGTEPRVFLQNLKKDGFLIYVIDEATKSLNNCNIDDLIKLCTQKKNGRGFANILLKK